MRLVPIIKWQVTVLNGRIVYGIGQLPITHKSSVKSLVRGVTWSRAIREHHM